jgi:hypothetical protein
VAFAQSIETILRSLWPDAAAAGLREPIDANHVLAREKGRALPTPIYRPFARGLVGRADTPGLRAIQINNRDAVLFSQEDLTAALVGSPTDGIPGYSPEAASELVTRLIVCDAMPATAPTSMPRKRRRSLPRLSLTIAQPNMRRLARGNGGKGYQSAHGLTLQRARRTVR